MTVNQDSKNLALIVWVATIFFGFIPGLIGYLVKKDDSFVLDHSKEALNWSITVIIGYFIATVLSIIVIGAFLFPIIGLCHLIFCIMAVIKASDGLTYRAPFAVRLIK
ncbi:DUF4870 domain-containing protein [Endozoicomonas sp. G2_1]|uniref:DUF4870 domain-containing protein n=1 Tax=Endozoicomonas sp. G2_1 TaxID=2821091 RepID=UPI001ADA4B33|nr:DUF4870 domain-containing protein [Endozoicomonas sp. G2_1]MBO9490007.1 DUF4870 domain-containing protein [Endozoicomonas sp. G2_1]